MIYIIFCFLLYLHFYSIIYCLKFQVFLHNKYERFLFFLFFTYKKWTSKNRKHSLFLYIIFKILYSKTHLIQLFYQLNFFYFYQSWIFCFKLKNFTIVYFGCFGFATYNSVQKHIIREIFFAKSFTG